MRIVLILTVLIGLVGCGMGNSKKSNKHMSTPTHDNVDVDKASEMIKNNENLVVLDVRTPGETAEGMLPGAIEIDVNGPDFIGAIDSLDRDKHYLVYCRSGVRSVTACNLMHTAGFTKLSNMLGGYNAWPK